MSTSQYYIGCLCTQLDKLSYYMLHFCRGTLNDKLSASRSLGHCPLGAVGQQFYVGPDRFVVREVFLGVLNFDGYITTISMSRSTRFRLDVSAISGILQY